MKYYMLELEIEGSKSIDKKIKLDFYKKSNVKKSSSFNDYNIKGIYGENGSGKTAIIDALKIYRGVATDMGYLFKNDDFLNETVNQSNKFISIRSKGMLYKENEEDEIIAKTIIEYELVVEKQHNKFSIKKEKAVVNNKVLYTTNDDELIEGIYMDVIKKNIGNHSTNFSMLSQIIEHLFHAIKSNKELEDKKSSKLIKDATSIYMFILHFYICSDESNTTSNIHKFTTYLEQLEAVEEENKGHIYEKLRRIQNINEIRKEDYEEYCESTKQLTLFMKLFKKNLIDIEIEKKEAKDVYIVERIFKYENAKIHERLESTGIQKLIKYFYAFEAVNAGKIVFIDELDANLHEIVMAKLIEYVSLNGRGQLVFTAHNLYTLDLIKKRKKSIDFLTNDSEIYSWVQKGNLSVANTYREGNLPGLAFNLSGIDFFEIFG